MTTSEVTEPGLVPLSRESVRQRVEPGGVLPEQSPRRIDIEPANEAARQDVQESRPHNTTRTHRSNWNVWLRFCKEYRIPPTLAEVATLVAFVKWMYQTGYSYNSARQNLSGTRVCLRQQGIEMPSKDADVVAEAMRNYERTVAQDGELRGRGKATPVMVKELRRVCAGLPDTVAGARDRALWLVGFGIGARRSELSNLLLSDVGVHPEGLLVRVRWSKTGQSREVSVLPGQNSATCPVQAWRAWLVASGMDQVPSSQAHEYPAFCQITRHGSVLGKPLSTRAVGDLLTRTANAAGVAGHITGHSLRAGMATEARRAGHDDKTIGRQGGWVDGSSSLHRYMRTVDRWADNALVGIGL